MKTVKARVLVAGSIDGVQRQINDIVEVTEDSLFDHRAALDAHPESVAYAMEIKRKENLKRAYESDILNS